MSKHNKHHEASHDNQRDQTTQADYTPNAPVRPSQAPDAVQPRAERVEKSEYQAGVKTAHDIDHTSMKTIKTGVGEKPVAQVDGVNDPFADQNKHDNAKASRQQRVENMADALKSSQQTINPDTGRPVNMPGQTDGYQENLNHPYKTSGRTVNPVETDEVQELRDAAVKAEMNGHPAGAHELRQRADDLHAARKIADPDYEAKREKHLAKLRGEKNDETK